MLGLSTFSAMRSALASLRLRTTTLLRPAVSATSVSEPTAETVSAMPASKFYAVRRGAQTGVFGSWDECRQQVHGFKGAQFKSFPTMAQAQQYVNNTNGLVHDADRTQLPHAQPQQLIQNAHQQRSFSSISARQSIPVYQFQPLNAHHIHVNDLQQQNARQLRSQPNRSYAIPSNLQHNQPPPPPGSSDADDASANPSIFAVASQQTSLPSDSQPGAEVPPSQPGASRVTEFDIDFDFHSQQIAGESPAASIQQQQRPQIPVQRQAQPSSHSKQHQQIIGEFIDDEFDVDEPLSGPTDNQHLPPIRASPFDQLPASSIFTLFTDGAARGNGAADSPVSSCGAVLFDHRMKIVDTYKLYLGAQTNNEAEYQGLIQGLLMAQKHNVRNLHVKVDSALLVGQTSGDWKVNKEHLKHLVSNTKQLLKSFDNVTLKQVPRAQNAIADQLANEAIDEYLQAQIIATHKQHAAYRSTHLAKRSASTSLQSNAKRQCSTRQ